ncbi:L-histidine N(alpha)-methyltransferase [Pseudonocardia sp. CA-107938]|uniref:L-histidine N(alpha)-methyltransferase n=1 Tax=Pseudonocardia sp. CA-107938 TaxID=3240021 RepID=UPI003D8E348B
MTSRVLPADEIIAVDGGPAFWRDEAALQDALREPVPRIPPVFGYDERGSELFEEITRLPSYYLTRVEWHLLREFGPQIGAVLDGAWFAELGCGSGKKTVTLLGEAHVRPAAYLPVDVSHDMLGVAAAEARAAVPALRVQPLWGRYDAALTWLRAQERAEPLIVGFLGSSIGNMTPDERSALLADIAATLRPGDGLLFSADLHKPAAVFEDCYNDPPGHTAFVRFRRNHLDHLNHRFGADFVTDRYVPRAHYVEATGMVEGLLHVTEDHTVDVAGVHLDLHRGDAINVGYSAKFDRARLRAEIEGHGLAHAGSWVDAGWQYGVFLAWRTP